MRKWMNFIFQLTESHEQKTQCENELEMRTLSDGNVMNKNTHMRRNTKIAYIFFLTYRYVYLVNIYFNIILVEFFENHSNSDIFELEIRNFGL